MSIRQADTETIWEELSESLNVFIRRRVQDERDVEDILQDVFSKIHKNLNGLKDERRLHSWVYQITRNAVADYYRQRNIVIELPDTLPAEPTPEPSADQEIAACLQPMINRLPDKYRQAIVLTEFEGLTQKEMGRQLGLSESGAKSRVQRARRELKNTLLDCCHFEFSHMGKMLDYQPRQNNCAPGCDGSCQE